MSASCQKPNSSATTGYVHSIESMGTVDGPGIRTVVFLSGCPLLCQYCHNVDVTVPKQGELYTPQDLAQKIARNKSYFTASGGGVTFSGGDPFFQTDFLAASLLECQKLGIHTVVDTSLFTSPGQLQKVIPHADLFMVSVKHMDNPTHKKLTRVTNERVFSNLRILAEQKVPFWIRMVILPGITDTEENLLAFEKLMHEIQPQKIDLLPYHTHGIVKWEELGWKYELSELRPPTEKEIHTVRDRLVSQGFQVMVNE